MMKKSLHVNKASLATLCMVFGFLFGIIFCLFIQSKYYLPQVNKQFVQDGLFVRAEMLSLLENKEYDKLSTLLVTLVKGDLYLTDKLDIDYLDEEEKIEICKAVNKLNNTVLNSYKKNRETDGLISECEKLAPEVTGLK